MNPNIAYYLDESTDENKINPYNTPQWSMIDVNGYKIKRIIGSGAFGTVYEAISPKGKVVAIKQINIDKIREALPTLNVENELKILNSIQSYCNESAVCLIDSFKDDDNLFIVMDYIKGPTLEDILGLNVYPEDEIDKVELMNLLIQTIENLHRAGIAHKDLKPDNIKYDTSKNIFRLVDFGLSCSVFVPQCTTVTNKLYRSPDMKKIKRNIKRISLAQSQASDIYSLGLILYQMYTLQTYKFNENIVIDPTKLPLPLFYLINDMLNPDWHLRPTISQVRQKFEDIQFKI